MSSTASRPSSFWPIWNTHKHTVWLRSGKSSSANICFQYSSCDLSLFLFCASDLISFHMKEFTLHQLWLIQTLLAFIRQIILSSYTASIYLMCLTRFLISVWFSLMQIHWFSVTLSDAVIYCHSVFTVTWVLHAWRKCTYSTHTYTGASKKIRHEGQYFCHPF